jgi:hypothetical protein
LSSLYSGDAFFFTSETAADPGGDYTQWVNRVKAPLLKAYVDMTAFGAAKQLALIFGFQAASPDARVQVYTDAQKITDQTLALTDNQFLLQIDSLDTPLWLYFIHTGGSWFFKGLSGYVV